MSFLSSIKAIGRNLDPTNKKSIVRQGIRQLDPTSSTAALGGVVKSGIEAIPGGSAVLSAVKAAGSLRSSTSKTAPTTPTLAAITTPKPSSSPLVAPPMRPASVGLPALGIGAVALWFLFK